MFLAGRSRRPWKLQSDSLLFAEWPAAALYLVVDLRFLTSMWPPESVADVSRRNPHQGTDCRPCSVASDHDCFIPQWSNVWPVGAKPQPLMICSILR